MKIFFIQQKKLRFLSFKTLSRTLLVVLISCLFISGSVTPFLHSSKEASSPRVSPGSGEILVFSSPLGKEDNVWILVNGEKREMLSENKATISVDMDCAIEVMSETNMEFTVTLLAGDSIELVGKTENIQCKKGINYICRCVLN